MILNSLKARLHSPKVSLSAASHCSHSYTYVLSQRCKNAQNILIRRCNRCVSSTMIVNHLCRRSLSFVESQKDVKSVLKVFQLMPFCLSSDDTYICFCWLFVRLLFVIVCLLSGQLYTPMNIQQYSSFLYYMHLMFLTFMRYYWMSQVLLNIAQSYIILSLVEQKRRIKI